MVSSNYHSTITTHTLMVVAGFKKNHIEKIMDYFVDFEEAFWKKHLFILMKLMTGNRDFMYYFCNHNSKKNLMKLFNEKFSLKRFDPEIIEIENDSVFLRGKIEVFDNEKESFIEAPPTTIFLATGSCKVRILEKSSFLVGNFELHQLE